MDAAGEPTCAYTDPCAGYRDTLESRQEEYGIVKFAGTSLLNAALRAYRELGRAQADLLELRRASAHVEKAEAEVKDAKARFDKDYSELRKWDNDVGLENLGRELGNAESQLAACRSRNDPPPAGRELARSTASGRTATGCTNQEVALARAKGRAGGYALLRRLTKINLSPIGRDIRAANAILQKAASKSKARRFRGQILSVVRHLKAAGGGVKSASSQIAGIKKGVGDSSKAVAKAQASLAKCQSGG